MQYDKSISQNIIRQTLCQIKFYSVKLFFYHTVLNTWLSNIQVENEQPIISLDKY